MTRRFFDLGTIGGPLRWRVPAEQRICVGPTGNVFMFGGVILGSALIALETTFGRPVICASSQFLSPIRPTETLELEIAASLVGRNVTQARAIGRVSGREAFCVHSALGARDSDVSAQWEDAPDVLPPEACHMPELWLRTQAPGTLHERLELRVPPEPSGDPAMTGALSRAARRVFWLRTREDLPMDVSLLALFGDFVPFGLAAVLGAGLGGTSLDNTLRVRTIVPTRWVLCDVHIQAIHTGFAHGDVRLFAEDGQLMAVGSQSINAWLPQISTPDNRDSALAIRS